ncbi:MAG: hypothetical protein LUQ71_08435 [Methanoregula sp.]|jgi:hypothetical protein|nr:hypothetical protein [Methanoregula sp.]
MNFYKNPFGVTLCITLILACVILCAGCTSPAATVASTPAPVTTTVQAPMTTEMPVMTVTTSSAAKLITASLSNGVTITYPADWQKEESSQLGMRDYGRTTLNIVNLYSPDITSELKAKDITNPDTATYTTLSIDVDPDTVTDFEQYFNLATLALQKTYGSIDITKHNYQLDISGYDAYELDFDTKTSDTTYLRGSYIFTDVDGTIYIFAFRNPTPYSAEVEDMYKSIKIVSPKTTTKHR